MRIVGLLLAVVCSPVLAGKPADDCRATLERNFAAMNSEDLSALAATIAPSCPRGPAMQFADEARAMFRETDAHLSLGGYQFLGVRGPFAAAVVTQYTVVSENGQPTPYRQASKLLPADETATYIQIFRRERGKWYIWTQQDMPATDAPSSMPVMAGCANGRCQMPNIRIQVQ